MPRALRGLWVLLAGVLLPEGAVPLSSELSALGEDLSQRNAWLRAQIAPALPLDMYRLDLVRYALAHERRSVFPLRLSDAEGRVYECRYEAPSAAPATTAGAAMPARVGLGPDGEPLPWFEQLHGVCSSFQKGWWTFQWCHRDEVVQYHLTPSGQRDPVWSLGRYQAPDEPQDPGAVVEPTRAPSSGPRRKSQKRKREGVTAAVEDSFEGGQRCDETKRPRHAVVKYRCCGDQEHTRATREGNVQNARTAAAHILSVREAQLCAYEILVCAQPLCDYENSVLRERAQRAAPPGAGAASAYAILLSSFGNVCLPRNEGWWTYEVCLTSGVRQFHMSAREDEQGHMVSAVEAEFRLGNFNEENLRAGPGEPVGHGNVVRVYTGQAEDGDMAFQLEFDHGTPCDVAALERATTLEVVCGEKNVLVSVVEDRTCHYRVRISSTELCAHPRFQKISQQQQRVGCRIVEAAPSEG